MQKTMLLLTCLGALSISSCTSVRYTPDDRWYEESYQEFYEDWFGDQLRAMKEPSLWEFSKQGISASEIRLLILPTFSPALSIRFSRLSDGVTQISLTKLDGAGGYDPGKIDYKKIIKTDGTKIDALLGEFDRLHFWSFPAGTGSVSTNEAGDEIVEDTIYVCADGTQLVLEAIDGRKYNFVTQHECGMTDAFHALALLALDSAGVPSEEHWIAQL